MLSVLPSTASNVTTISQVLPSSITKYHQILPCSICTQYCMSVWHAVLVLSHGDYYKIVQSITKYYQILPNSTKYCQILQGLSGAQCCCHLTEIITKYCCSPKVLPNSTKYCQVLPSIAKYYKVCLAPSVAAISRRSPTRQPALPPCPTPSRFSSKKAPSEKMQEFNNLKKLNPAPVANAG